MAPCHFGCFLTPKTPFFGPSWTWNDTWMGHKSVQNTFSHCLGCVMAHYHVSRLNFSSNMASCHFGCCLTSKTPIFGPTWTWNDNCMGIKVSNTSFPIAWGVFWSIFLFPSGLLGWHDSLPSWSILTQKMGIFGRPLTWNGIWRGSKWPQTTFPYV